MPARMPLVLVVLCAGATSLLPAARAQLPPQAPGQFLLSGAPPAGWPPPAGPVLLGPPPTGDPNQGEYRLPPPLAPPAPPQGALAAPPPANLGPQGLDVFEELGPRAPTVLPLEGQSLAAPFAPAATTLVPWWYPEAWLPRVSERWHQRPIGLAALAGVFSGDVLAKDDVEMESASFFGLRLDRDYDDRWSWEGRVAIAQPDVVNVMGPPDRRSADVIFGDSSLVFSPSYSDRFRTFLSFGGGVALFDFVDHNGRSQRETVPTLPLGAGLRYRVDEWLVLQLDVRDNIVLGSGHVERMHLLTLSGSAELRFGGAPFWPWDSRRYVWYE